MSLAFTVTQQNHITGTTKAVDPYYFMGIRIQQFTRMRIWIRDQV